MNKPTIENVKRGPERIIQDALINYLKIHDWYVMETHGNVYSRGFPDLFATHKRYGQRWVEVKKPVGYSFTPAQLECFPLLEANGSGVWVLTAATQHEYEKLFQKSNWSLYLMLMNSHPCT
jgi:hypothetical protein